MPTPPRVARARRDARAKNAKAFINKTVPAVLKSNARARRGVESAHVIVDPHRFEKHDTKSSRDGIPALEHVERVEEVCAVESKGLPHMRITLRVCDTLEAASRLYFSTFPTSRVAILNMASPLRPGGGVLTGATSQEEWLCARTTLYPSLREDFYRLPEVGGVYTQDVLALRSWDASARDLPRDERFFVDVVSSAMLRMPDLEGGTYAEQIDKEMVVRKMRGVLRMVRGKSVMKLVLGAWGCGAYGNPVGEVARAWKRVLCGRNRDNSDGEGWDGLEVVFAIKDPRMAVAFAREFGDGISVEEDADGDPSGAHDDHEDSESFSEDESS